MSEPRETRPVLAALGALMGYWGYTDALNMAAAPHLAVTFGLGDSAIAAAFGWCAVGALVSLPIARSADRRGRKRVLLACVAVLAPLSLLTAVAPSVEVFVGAQMGVHALKGVLMTVIPVMVAEALSTEGRARGQAIVAAVGHVGAGLALGIVAACAELPGTWRWGWGLAAPFALLLLFAARSLAESTHFERASASGEAGQSRARELFAPTLRARTLGVLAVGTLYPFATTGAQFWLIYHPVRHLGIEPWIATVVVIAGGAFSMLGFALGARLCGGWGRRGAFAFSSAIFVVGAIAFYRVPADFAPHPGVGLGLAFAGMSLGSSAGLVALRAASTELFPTRLRGAISGWLAVTSAAALVAVNFNVALLAALLGGIAPAASIAAAAMPVAAVVFLAVLPETRGVELE